MDERTYVTETLFPHLPWLHSHLKGLTLLVLKFSKFSLDDFNQTLSLSIPPFYSWKKNVGRAAEYHCSRGYMLVWWSIRWTLGTIHHVFWNIYVMLSLHWYREFLENAWSNLESRNDQVWLGPQMDVLSPFDIPQLWPPLDNRMMLCLTTCHFFSKATSLDNRGKPILDSVLKEATQFSYGVGHFKPDWAAELTERIDAVVNCTQIRVKNKAKFTNLMV